jgi:hypothetical protein
VNIFKVCCDPCEQQKMCCESHSCCVECHCSFEELHALPHVPKALADRIRREHYELQQAGFPAGPLLDHSRREMEIFRQYCPSDVLEQITDDHAAYEAGTLGLQPAETITMNHPLTVGAPQTAYNCPPGYYFNGYHCVPYGKTSSATQQQQLAPMPVQTMRVQSPAPMRVQTMQPLAPAPMQTLTANPRGGGGGGRRGGGSRHGGGGGRHGGGFRLGGRGLWWGGGFPYYPYQQATVPGFDCIEFDAAGNCVLLKRQGADVNLLAKNPEPEGPRADRRRPGDGDRRSGDGRSGDGEPGDGDRDPRHRPVRRFPRFPGRQMFSPVYYYVPQEVIPAGWECIERDAQGRCVLMKRIGAVVTTLSVRGGLGVSAPLQLR